MNAYKKFGVQSMYSMPRRRYNTGRYLTKKYNTKKAYTRRVNLKRNLKSGETTFKVQDVQYIYPVANILRCYGVNTIGDGWLNINTAISNSLTWTQIAANWSLFRLNGILIKVARVFNENTGSLGTNTLSSPPLYINYYPTITSINQSNESIMSADSSLRVDPYVTGYQQKYISIPKNFSNLTTGIGLGTWNPVVSIASLPGEIAVAGAVPSVTGLVTTNPVFEMIVTFYISVCNDKP